MDKYYYLVSSLPTIYFDKQPEISINSFLQEAEKWLTIRDYKIISGLSINDVTADKSDPRLSYSYKKFEYQLRSDLAGWREAKHINIDYKPVYISLALITEGDPLEVEINLLKLRWDFLDARQHEHHFDLEYLLIYYLKLQILYRLAQFNKEKGIEMYQKICRTLI
jgi:hypothetical protein